MEALWYKARVTDLGRKAYWLALATATLGVATFGAMHLTNWLLAAGVPAHFAVVPIAAWIFGGPFVVAYALDLTSKPGIVWLATCVALPLSLAFW